MNPRVHKRRRHVARLLQYLFCPGRDEEHVDPRLVAVWDGAGDLGDLQPRVRADGRHDVTRLAALLMQPVHAGRNPPPLVVWHCSVRNAPEDRLLSDGHWAQVAAEVMDAVKLAPIGDLAAVRWVAVRHNDDHIHLVATLVRQDGRTAWAWNDGPNARRRCYQLERRFGLRRVGPMDGTSAKASTPVEVNKAQRLRKPATARDELRRHVRAAAAASAGEDEFFARLADAGVLVRFRHSTQNPGERTGYTVALPGHTTAAGVPVWFSGGKLAADLTLPKLRQRWHTPDTSPTRPDLASVRITAEARAQALTDAATSIRAAADAITHLAGDSPQAASAVAQAASDTLTAVATAVEGRRRGPVSAAAELFDKASRGQYGHTARATQRSAGLRSMSRLVALMGRMATDKDTFAMLALLLDLARLADTLALLRDAQDRVHQAQAARDAAATLRAAVAAAGRFGPADPTLAGSHTPAPAETQAIPGLEPLNESIRDHTDHRPGR